MNRLGWLFGLVIACSAPCLPVRAQTKGFALDRFEPAERGSDWFVGESLDLRGHLRPAAGLTLEYAHKPLVLYDAQGDERAAIVSGQLHAHLGGSLVLWDRVRAGLSIPIALAQSGEVGSVGALTFDASGATTFGDIRLGGDVRLLGQYGAPLVLAAGLQMHLPTGDREAFTGDGKVRLTPRALVAGELGQLVYSARLSLIYRAQDEPLGGIPIGTELGFVATAGMRAMDGKLLLGPELYGSTVVSEGSAAFEKETTPFELLLGGHYRFGDYLAGLGIGPGLTRGLGSPSVRVVASFDWHPAIMPPPEAVVMPDEPADRDGDGILDRDDACPDEKGVASDDPKKHGCPAEAPTDRDGDGVLDDDDACPDTPGEASDDPAKNGCPGDRDGDGIIDSEDACPDAAGPASDDPAKNGCPKARVESGEIKIIERVEFETDSDKLLSASDEILEAVRAILEAHPEITRVSVEGHTDNVGKAAYNKRLSDRRARAVREWLVGRGIKKRRLESHGFGLDRPIGDNATEAGRQQNRRVEFHIRKVDDGGKGE